MTISYQCGITIISLNEVLEEFMNEWKKEQMNKLHDTQQHKTENDH